MGTPRTMWGHPEVVTVKTPRNNVVGTLKMMCRHPGYCGDTQEPCCGDTQDDAGGTPRNDAVGTPSCNGMGIQQQYTSIFITKRHFSMCVSGREKVLKIMGPSSVTERFGGTGDLHVILKTSRPAG